MLGVDGPFWLYAAGVNSLVFAASILILLTLSVTVSTPALGAETADAAVMDGEEPPVVLGTKTAAAALRALRPALRGLDRTLEVALALLEGARDAAVEVGDRVELN